MTDGGLMPDLDANEHEYLTVKELADLLRLKERKIYDLAASGEVPCSKATGKLLFPAAEVRAWIDRAKSGGISTAPENAPKRPPIILGSHDPLLDWAIRQSRCGLATFHDGSGDGLNRFARGEGVAAGLHLFDPGSKTWNQSAASRAAKGQNAVLVQFATRQRGLVHRPDDPAPRGLDHLDGLKVVPRQAGSGTDTLFHHLVGKSAPKLTLTNIARTEDDAVDMVKRGNGDVAFGLKAVADSYGLSFVPVIEEQFSLLMDRAAWFETPMQSLLNFCSSKEFQDRAIDYGGYDVSGFGRVLWNA